MTDNSSNFDIIIDDDRWVRALDGLEDFARQCRRAASAFVPRVSEGAALLFADDEVLRDLNRRFRRIDKPTNVLSFPSGAPGRGFLGDIAIAYETSAKEADAQGIAFRDHVAHLIVHGLLHLAGYDHEDDKDANRMESLETKILARLEIADPYGADGARGF